MKKFFFLLTVLAGFVSLNSCANCGSPKPLTTTSGQTYVAPVK